MNFIQHLINLWNSIMNIQTKSTSKITINGQSFYGNNVSMVNNKITVDGKVVEMSVNTIQCNIVIEGDADTVRNSTGDIVIQGSVKCDVHNSVGDVTIHGDVTGDVSTSTGDVRCGNVTGKVKTSVGDIYYNKTPSSTKVNLDK